MLVFAMRNGTKARVHRYAQNRDGTLRCIVDVERVARLLKQCRSVSVRAVYVNRVGRIVEMNPDTVE